MSKTYSAGIVTAYGAAKRAGYQGTYEDFCRQQAGYAENAAAVEQAKTDAINAKNDAVTVKNTAVSAKDDAVSAKDIAVSAKDTAVAKASEASASATTATTKATEAAASATSAANAASAAQGVLESIPEDYSDLSEDVDQLKADLADVTNHAVKSAEQLISDKRTVDKAPYKYRASASGKSDRAYDMIVGGTVCFNQLISSVRNSTTVYGLTLTKSDDGHSLAISGTANNSENITVCGSIGVAENHVYLADMGAPSISGALINFANVGSVGQRAVIRKSSTTGNASLALNVANGTEINMKLTPQIFDLTQMFGTTIADHIYALEQANAGTGVALFRAMFPNEYYPYNAGNLISVAGLSAKEVVGFNLINFVPERVTGIPAFDVNKSVRVLKGYTYEWCHEGVKNATTWRNAFTCYDNSGVRIVDSSAITVISVGIGYNVSASYFVDSSNNTVKSEIFTTNFDGYIMPFFLLGDTSASSVMVNPCIHLVGDGAKNGTYEPYHKTTYPLDSSLTLRGVPVLKDGKIEFDGDTYEADGTVTRRYAERAYQSGDESLANAITDGTNTVYKLSVETTETAIPYASPQIVAPYGTEEYISETVCPVGHVTEYPDNLRAKIDGLPWDLSMIAPVETAYKATRNYTVNQLLIVDNTLYKVTSNIANGGTITAGTNVVATTLSEVIASLS